MGAFVLYEPDCTIPVMCEHDLLPVKAHHSDACFDIRSSVDMAVDLHGGPVSIPTGLYFDIPYGWEIQVRGRSGLAFKDSLIAFPGTIDSGYRGEVKVLLTPVKPKPMFYRVIDFFNGAPIKYIHRGDRIAQIKISKVYSVILNRVDKFTSDTDRSTSGFGSTGSK